jgi:hypothetical protein
MLIAQGNLAITYEELGRLEPALRLRRDVYLGRLKLNGEQHEETLRAANNYAKSLKDLERFKEARALMRRTIPVARHVLGDKDRLTLKMRVIYAEALYEDPAATLADLREAVDTLEDTDRIARRVLGAAHPIALRTESNLRDARAALAARDGDVSSVCEAMEAMTPG